MGKLNLEDPTQLLKGLMSGDVDGADNGLKDLITNITGKIHDKISSGDIDEEKLFKEATNVMGKFGGGKDGSNPFGDLFKNMPTDNSNDVNPEDIFKNMTSGDNPFANMFKQAMGNNNLNNNLNSMTEQVLNSGNFGISQHAQTINNKMK